MEKYKKAQRLDIALQNFRKSGVYKRNSNTLTDADLAVLFTIKFAEDNIKIKLTDIANKLELTLPAVTHKVNDLEERGLLVKKVSTNDRRVVNLELTTDAKKELDSIVDSYYNPLFILMDRLGKEDSKTLLKILDKVNAQGKIIK
ncbi:MAG TPA: MarR family transcriptional regulator [Acholeplasmataceae bacterium]|nr:MarR family transcriptional regulator [Acholeplasmataceae bacterium]